MAPEYVTDLDESEFVRLNEEQLRTLATVLYYQELEAINCRPFTSEPELVAYLHDCKDGYGHALSILDDGAKVKEQHAGDEEKGEIVDHLIDFTLNFLEFSLQCVDTYRLRLKYLKDLRETNSHISKALETSAENLTNLKRLVKDVCSIHKDMLDHNKKYHNNISRLFSEKLKETNATLEHFLQKYGRRHGIAIGALQELDEVAQRGVLTDILSTTEQLENKSMTRYARGSGILGGGMLLATAGMMAWDVYTSDNKLNSVANNGYNVVSGLTPGLIGTSVSRSAAGAFATALFMAFDIATSDNKIETAAKDSVSLISSIGSTLVTAGILGVVEVTGAIATCALGGAAFVVALAVGFLINEIGNHFLEKIFKKKDKAQDNKTSLPLPLATDGHQFFIPNKPDARALALEIAYLT